MDEDLFEEEIISQIKEYLEENAKENLDCRDKTDIRSKANKLIAGESDIADEFEKIISDFNKEIEVLIRQRDYDRAEKFISIVKRLEGLKIKTLKILSSEYISTDIQENKKQIEGNSLNTSITPMETYYLPLLETLYELGGRGKTREVIERVGEKMRDILTPYDYEYLPSGGSIRWENRVQWARLKLVHKGLLKRDSPKGIWELSEKGYRYIEDLKKKKSNDE